MTRENKDARTPSTCRSCKAPVIWVITERGKKMPCDAEPDPGGKYVLAYSQTRNEMNAAMYRDGEHQGRRRFTSHFQTCPNASEHSGGGR